MTLSLKQIHPFINWLLANSLQSSILIVIVLGLTYLLRKRLPASILYGLWLILLLKMLLPWNPESRISLYNVTQFPPVISAMAAAAPPPADKAPATSPNVSKHGVSPAYEEATPPISAESAPCHPNGAYSKFSSLSG